MVIYRKWPTASAFVHAIHGINKKSSKNRRKSSKNRRYFRKRASRAPCRYSLLPLPEYRQVFIINIINVWLRNTFTIKILDEIQYGSPYFLHFPDRLGGDQIVIAIREISRRDRKLLLTKQKPDKVAVRNRPGQKCGEKNSEFFGGNF